MSSRTLLVGGLGRARDLLAVAALRAGGVEAALLPAPSDAGLERARALGNHGQCNPAHYAVGQVLEHASGKDAGELARTHAWLVPGSCGPCRLAAFPLEWQRVLDRAGLGALEVQLLDQLAVVPAIDRACGSRPPGFGLVAALVAGDVLEQLALSLRPYVTSPASLDAAFSAAADEVAAAVAERRGLAAPLRAAAARLSALDTERDRVLPRVLVTGEPWTTLAGGAPAYDAAARLAELGAELEAPRLVDWLRALCWQRSRERRVEPADRRAAVRAVRTLGALWRRLAAAAGLPTALDEPDVLAALTAPWYPAEVKGGSAHLELGRALGAASTHAAHLVLSLKPFGCLPSSALSDGIVGPLLRRLDRAPAFLALETTGDAHATADSRLELALHAATLRALGELEVACAARGLEPAAARRRLAVRPTTSLSGPRTFACTAAERVARGEADVDRDVPPRADQLAVGEC